MSSALEVLGMSLPYSSSTPAVYPGEIEDSRGNDDDLPFVHRKNSGVFQGCQVHEAFAGVGLETKGYSYSPVVLERNCHRQHSWWINQCSTSSKCLYFMYFITERYSTCSPLHEPPTYLSPSTTSRKFPTERLTLLTLSINSVMSAKFPGLIVT